MAEPKEVANIKNKNVTSCDQVNTKMGKIVALELAVSVLWSMVNLMDYFTNMESQCCLKLCHCENE